MALSGFVRPLRVGTVQADDQMGYVVFDVPRPPTILDEHHAEDLRASLEAEGTPAVLVGLSPASDGSLAVMVLCAPGYPTDGVDRRRVLDAVTTWSGWQFQVHNDG